MKYSIGRVLRSYASRFKKGHGVGTVVAHIILFLTFFGFVWLYKTMSSHYYDVIAFLETAAGSFILFIVMFIVALWLLGSDEAYSKGPKCGIIMWMYVFPPYAVLSFIFSAIRDGLITTQTITTDTLLNISTISI